jgi:hypothetical protein
MATVSTTPGTRKNIRMDKLEVGQIVTLAFHKSASTTMEKGGRVDYEEAVFMGIVGEGEDRHAEFISGDARHMYRWAAYRFQGRWAFGSSAERLSVVDVQVFDGLRSK